MKYLIVKCEELGDQFECDADRTPITMTDDWKKWYNTNKPKYLFEVYEFVNNKFNLVKGYEDSLEFGMCFTYYPDENDIEPTNIKKYPNYTRDSAVPKEVLKRFNKGEEQDDSLESCGYLSWLENDVLYCYTSYYDNIISSPF